MSENTNNMRISFSAAVCQQKKNDHSLLFCSAEQTYMLDDEKQIETEQPNRFHQSMLGHMIDRHSQGASTSVTKELTSALPPPQMPTLPLLLELSSLPPPPPLSSQNLASSADEDKGVVPQRVPVAGMMPPNLTVTQTNPHIKQSQISNLMADNMVNAPVTGDDHLDQCLRTNWSAIKTKVRRGALIETINIRILGDNGIMLTVEERMMTIHHVMTHIWTSLASASKVNCSYGSILMHKTNGENRYHHVSSNNATVFNTPSIIRSRQDMEEFCDRLGQIDVELMATNRRPNTSWKLRLLTNVSFYIYKIPGMENIGAGKRRAPKIFPAYLQNSKALRGVGQNFDDNLCFFRCLAVRMSCTCSGDICKCVKRFDKFERDTVHLYQEFVTKSGQDVNVEGFPGMNYDDLLLAETIFNVRIVVYSMQPDRSTTIVWQSGCTAKDS